MTVVIEAMYIAPVKALALTPVERAYLDKPGISGDRAFFIVDESGALFTQREHGALVQVAAAYDPATGELRLDFPDGSSVSGAPEAGEPLTAPFFAGRPVEGHVVRGEWNDALSEFAGRPLRLVKTAKPGSSFDGYPLSMCSTASLRALARAAGAETVDGRRFRQNIYISAAVAHLEDEWIGREVRVGRAVLRVKLRDSRCVVTTHSPDTGETDMNTLKIIASYRRDQPKQVNFGVYCTVVQPGDASIGDVVIAPDG